MSKKFFVFSSDLLSLVNFKYELLHKLVEIGFKVTVCAPPNLQRFDLQEKLSLINVNFTPVKLSNTSTNPFTNLINFLNLCKLIKRESPNYVLNCFIKPVIFCSIAAHFSKVKNIYSIIEGLGYVFIGNSFKLHLLKIIVMRLYKFSLKYNRKVFFLNQDDIDFFQTNKLIRREKTVLINGTGINLDKFVQTPPPASISFLFVGRLLKDKGIIEYYNAAKYLKRKYPKVIFKMAGELCTNPSSITKGQLTEWKNSGVIEYLGFIKDIRCALRESAVFVLPSYREGVPRAGLEALSTGRPIITTNAPGCKEIVKDSVNGYLVPIKNEEALVVAMEKFILNQSLVQIMGTNSRALAETKFDVYCINRQIIENLS